MAPHSDVDIAFLVPRARTPWCEQVIEAMLYFLWDLGLKVGHSSRTPDDTGAHGAAKTRPSAPPCSKGALCGATANCTTGNRALLAEVVTGTEKEFVADKLAERDARHQRMGDSRYVVEPNVKDGKGGLRDLQTLYWIGKYIHKVRVAADLVDADLFTRAEYRSFRRAEGFLLAVRCHLHELTGRAEDRLTFDLQRAGGGTDAVRRPAGQKRGRTVHAVLFPAGEARRQPDRRVPGAYRRTIRAARRLAGLLERPRDRAGLHRHRQHALPPRRTTGSARIRCA